MVGMAVDWWGMSFPDAAFLVSDLITAPNQAPRFVERVHQGMANQLVLTWAAQQGLWQLPQTQVAAKVDMAQIYFYGLSQGHILGGTQVALNPRLSKAALGVGGAGFGLMMSRAAPFETFLAMLEGATGSRQGATRAALLLGTPLERIDPVTYAPWLLASAQGYGAPLPGNPPQRQILMHAGFADTQVPNLATHVHARALGLALLAPAARPVFGLSPKAAPLESALVEFNMGYKPLDMLGISAPCPLPSSRSTSSCAPAGLCSRSATGLATPTDHDPGPGACSTALSSASWLRMAAKARRTSGLSPLTFSGSWRK
jgi:hypothetical protein